MKYLARIIYKQIKGKCGEFTTCFAWIELAISGDGLVTNKDDVFFLKVPTCTKFWKRFIKAMTKPVSLIRYFIKKHPPLNHAAKSKEHQSCDRLSSKIKT